MLRFSSLVAAPGHGGLIRVLHPGLSPQDRACDLGERRTVGDRWEPLGSDGVWTKRGPPIGCRTTQRSASVQRCNGLIRSAEGRAAGPEPPTTAPTGPIGARVFHGLHETAARYKSVWIVPAERFPIRDPPVDHRQVIWGCAAWAQPSRQAGDLSFRGWTAEPPAQRRHGVSLAGPLEVEEVGFEPASAVIQRSRSLACRCGDLRVCRTRRDRSCPPGSLSDRCGTDPTQTGATT
jgi:hypothetical protein